MAYIQKRLSKKVNAGKSQIIFHIGISRTIKFRYKTGINIEPEFWSDKTNDLRNVTKASKFPPAILRKIRGYAAEMDELEETILYIIGEFPNLVGTKVKVEDNEKNESTEMYWLELALECVADMDKSDMTKEIIEKAVSARLRKKTDVEETKHVSIYALGQQFLEKRDLCQRRIDSYNVMFRVMCRYEVFRSKTTGIEWHWNLNATTKDDTTDFVDYIRHESEYQDKYKDIFSLSAGLYPTECTPKHKCARIHQRGNYIAGMYKKVKAFWHWMQKNGLSTVDPFFGVEVTPEIYGTPFYLTVEEQDQSIVSKMSGHAEGSKAFSRYRDIDDDTLAEVIKAMQ